MNMGKAIAIILILLAIIGGGIYYAISQNKPASITSGLAPTVTSKTPSLSQTSLSTTDESIDSDMTALDKDLAGLDASDKTLTQDVNGL